LDFAVSRQYQRRAQVIIGKNGAGLSVTDARITFEVTKTVKATPNTALIKIYNLNATNEARAKTEFDEVILNAGYLGAIDLVFRGNIKHVYRYRDGADRITEIEAGDGDHDYQRAVMNKTFAAGTDSTAIVAHAVETFAGVGGTVGGEMQVSGPARIRGKVVSGNTRDALDDLARQVGANWSIQDGQLEVIGSNATRAGVAIVVTSDTGLLSAPEVSDKGIGVVCLMNPKIKINGALKLDNNSIKAKHKKQPDGKAANKPKKENVRLDPDGVYKVIKLVHKGDTHGQDWTTTSTCIGLGQPIPAAESESEFDEQQ
jgi:hypothetical protein